MQRRSQPPMPTHPAPDSIGRRARPQRASRLLGGVALAALASWVSGGCELRRVPDGAWRPRQLATRGASSHTQAALEWPRVYALDAEALARAKRRIESGDPRIQPAYDRLLREAGAAPPLPPPPGVGKHHVPPPGGKHDHASIGPPSWPHPPQHRRPPLLPRHR